MLHKISDEEQFENAVVLIVCHLKEKKEYDRDLSREKYEVA